ncbi:outer membrane beta-barrel protein [Cecembia lonarensis]|uniref:Outer membrane protein beta-barrel domain-containing protein n=1 Tax=Cecembia lonarensis (strain CCUG 58316 / KCTC 22772 / LW9) TaxID=1225176 RepID=K1LUT3_CECL9|nr:outer membrane beta-barrel protein [Cecembia lonarensis]EKB47904.1 hypothetical protein B879_03492 [Cecembia lonarensis LW9]
MKTYNKVLILLACFSLLSTGLTAQVQLSKFGVSLSQWTRNYSEFDERFFFTTPPSEQGGYTASSIMPSIFAEVSIYKGISLEGRIGSWSRTYTDISSFGNLTIQESLKQRVIPASLSVLYNYSFLDNFNAYAGLGVTRYFIQHEVLRLVPDGSGSVAPQEFSGNNYGINYMIGVEYYFNEKIGVGLEGRFHNGAYNKSFVPEFGANSVTRTIDLKGLEIGISLRYRLFSSSSSED